jgi:hypothetical protein
MFKASITFCNKMIKFRTYINDLEHCQIIIKSKQMRGVITSKSVITQT